MNYPQKSPDDSKDADFHEYVAKHCEENFPNRSTENVCEIVEVLQSHNEDIDAGEAKLFSDGVQAVMDEWFADNANATWGSLLRGLHKGIRGYPSFLSPESGARDTR